MQYYSSIGLALNMFGVFLLFFFGFPQPNFEEGVGLTAETNTILENGKSVKDIVGKTKKRKILYKILSFFALFCLFIGFAFQLYAIWC